MLRVLTVSAVRHIRPKPLDALSDLPDPSYETRADLPPLLVPRAASHVCDCRRDGGAVGHSRLEPWGSGGPTRANLLPTDLPVCKSHGEWPLPCEMCWLGTYLHAVCILRAFPAWAAFEYIQWTFPLVSALPDRGIVPDLPGAVRMRGSPQSTQLL